MPNSNDRSTSRLRKEVKQPSLLPDEVPDSKVELTPKAKRRKKLQVKPKTASKQRRAKPGGETINGKFYRGGLWIPEGASEGDQSGNQDALVNDILTAHAAFEDAIAASKQKEAEIAEEPSLEELFAMVDEIGSKYDDGATSLDAYRQAKDIVGDAMDEAVAIATGKVRRLKPKPKDDKPNPDRPSDLKAKYVKDDAKPRPKSSKKRHLSAVKPKSSTTKVEDKHRRNSVIAIDAWKNRTED